MSGSLGAGVDYGVRRIAYAVPGAGTVAELKIPIKAREDPANWYRLANWLGEQVAAHDIDAVAIEAPIEGRAANVQTAVRMGGAFGALVVALVTAGVPLIWTVAPSSWKKEICGFGAAGKDDVARWLAWSSPALSRVCCSQDGVDATVLGMYADLALTRMEKGEQP